MIDVDSVFRDLEQVPVPSRLSLIDDAVLQALADIESQRRALGAKQMAVAAGAALLIGIAGAAVPGTTARAAPAAPLGGDLSLAPSTLLDSSR